MTRRKVTGILGVWTVLLAFMGIPFGALRVLIILTGLAVAFVSFSADITKKIRTRYGERAEEEGR